MNSESAIKILSIDPRKAPAGSLNPEMTLRFMRRRGIAESVMIKRNARVAESVFGTSASLSTSTLLLAFRLLFGSALIVSGLLSIFGALRFDVSPLMSVLMMTAGSMTVCGLFNRILGIAGIIVCALSLLSGLNGLFLVLSSVAFLLLAITGPGRFSMDRSLQRRFRNRLVNSENSGRGLDDYRAFARL